jgi:hypothetical protein
MIFMRHFLLIGFLVITFFNLSSAQGELEPGYIVKVDGDTVSGYIMYEVDSKLAERVKFYHRQDEDEAQIYTPADLKAIGFHSGRVFESVKIGSDSTAYFGKKISTGKINMFSIRFDDSDKTRYQLIQSDNANKIALDPPVKSEMIRDGKKYNHRDNIYLGRLSLITENKFSAKELEKVKYRTKSMQKFIRQYNEGYSVDYPVSTYRDAHKYTFDITVGAPVYLRSEINDYRIAAYVDKTNRETSTKFSYRMGVSFRYWKRKEGNYEDGSDIQKMLKVIPFGFKWQSEPKKLMPYGYLGAGLIYYQDINYKYENREKVDEYRQGGIGIALNIGVGVKVKVGKSYLLAEYTPAIIESIGFFNIGYSF